MSFYDYILTDDGAAAVLGQGDATVACGLLSQPQKLDTYLCKRCVLAMTSSPINGHECSGCNLKDKLPATVYTSTEVSSFEPLECHRIGIVFDAKGDLKYMLDLKSGEPDCIAYIQPNFEKPVVTSSGVFEYHLARKPNPGEQGVQAEVIYDASREIARVGRVAPKLCCEMIAALPKELLYTI